MTIRVTVWGENVHEHKHEVVGKLYPEGMHGQIAKTLNEDPEIEARTATLQEPEHGLTKEVLANTDVLTWWGHCAHGDVDDAIVDRVQTAVLQGMGLLVLHSGHFAKIFKRLMGTSCALKWREAGEKERLWCCNPGHAIAQGVPHSFELEHTEMYGEPFGIPTPDENVFISWFQGGEVFRSGCTWRRGAGKIFYFRPGHETYPIYYNETIQLILKNAVKWAKPEGTRWTDVRDAPHVPADKAPEPITVHGGSVH
ncbi:MAG: ThuA domain-containing protein [Planctomycetota bacterium]|jgi:trehalose utilization protein|nr:ThuA domain-containing protein [Planctomycetota bacterium]